MAADLPSFEAPPINEVVIGVRFRPIDEMLLTHFGLFWASLRNDFGESEEAIPMGTPEGVAVSKAGQLPLPRTWLINNDKQYLIQLQSNIFYFNWRKQSESQNYPRYSKIKPMFYDYIGLFIKFLYKENITVPKIFNGELTYVNIIPQENNNYFSGVFPDLSWRSGGSRLMPPPSGFSWNSTHVFDDRIELTTKIQTAKRVSDESTVLRFEISARETGSGSSLETSEEWFDRAHNAIVSSFVDLTNPRIQQELWKRTDDPS